MTKEVDEAKESFNMYKIKVFDRAGNTIYSTEKEDIGSVNKHSYFHEIVLKGNTYQKMAKKDTYSLDGSLVPIDVMETYIPYKDDSGNILVIFETYYDLSERQVLAVKLLINTLTLIGVTTVLLLLGISIASRKGRRYLLQRDEAEKRLKDHQELLEHAIRERTLELEKANKSLLNMESVRKDFIANISHEIKTPLTSIKGFVETLEDGALDDKETSKKFLTIIKKNTDMITKLTTDLLNLSELEHGQSILHMVEFDINTLILEVIDSVRQIADEQSVSIQYDVNFGDMNITADRLKIKEMIINLVENAIKYGKSGGMVAMTVSDRQDKIFFKVKDNGIGISEENLALIFERFFRADKSHSRIIGGTGLGLPIVKHIVELHGGTINVESRLDEGTTFTVLLPRKT
jgi:signal transduction histidine kinase